MREVLSLEKGVICKDHGGRIRVCLVYPNVYSLGMANLGYQRVYGLFNNIENCVAERAFLPDKADRIEFARTGTRLFSYESQAPLGDFDIVAFSIPFESDYLNVPEILRLSGIPVLSSERKGYPIVIAGGVGVSLNPEPISDIIDAFVIGEGEGAVEELIGLFEGLKRKGGASKEEVLRGIDSLDFAYVPSLYSFEYDNEKVKGITPIGGAKARVRSSRSLGLEGFSLPCSVITTPLSEFKDMRLIEVERGCGRGCRFCAAGFLYLPPRNRPFEEVRSSIEEGVKGTGKVGLVGAAVSEYPYIKEALRAGASLGGEVTLSSLRLDVLDAELAGLLKEAGYRTVTIAPEAGTARLRDSINKCITDEGIIDSVRLLAGAGFTRLKLYFLIGLPGETDDDAEAIGDLVLRIKDVLGRGRLTLSVNPFIPKPFTPFQWQRFEDPDVLEKRFSIVRKALSKRGGVTINPVSIKESLVQAYVARADRRAVGFVTAGSQNEAKKFLKENSSLIEGSLHRIREREEIFPWEVIDHGIRKEYLWKEYQRGLKGLTTPPCDVGRCFRCGVCEPAPATILKAGKG